MAEGTKITKSNIKDIEFVLEMAYSSEYLDSKSDKVCQRVERWINEIKLQNDRRNNLLDKCEIQIQEKRVQAV